MKLGFLVMVVAGLAACPAPVGTTALTPVSSDSTAQCREYCQNIGLPLESVVIMANNVGCVCDAKPPMAAPAPAGPPAMSPVAPSASTGAPAAAGGMAAVVMAQAEERRRQNQQQQNQQQQNAATYHHH